MKVFEAGGDSSAVESGLISGEGFDWSQVSEEFTTVDEFQDQVEMFGVLGEAFEVDDEGMADLWMNKVFVIDVINLLGLDDLTFVKKFEGDILAGFFVLGHFDFTEAALSEDSADLVVFQLELSDGLTFSFFHGICLNIDYNQIENHLFFYTFLIT